MAEPVDLQVNRLAAGFIVAGSAPFQAASGAGGLCFFRAPGNSKNTLWLH